VHKFRDEGWRKRRADLSKKGKREMAAPVEEKVAKRKDRPHAKRNGAERSPRGACEIPPLTPKERGSEKIAENVPEEGGLSMGEKKGGWAVLIADK